MHEKIPIYEEAGCKIVVGDNPFSVVILTPIMSRSHLLTEAADVCFVDSMTSCGAQSLSVTFFLCPCAAGVVPLAAVIAEGQSEADYACVFRRLRDSGCASFGGSGFPRVLITGLGEAERGGLRLGFPESEQSMSSFQVRSYFYTLL